MSEDHSPPVNTGSASPLPLDGLLVLDVASFIAGPAAATVMADFGAEVIKIEPPGAGDPHRRLHLSPGMPESDAPYCWMVEGRNKRSLALDLGQDDGRAVLHRLVERADVLVTNFPDRVRERLGLRYADLAPLNPRLIYASLTGYGETGPDAARPAFDIAALWARSRMMDSVKPHSGAEPAMSLPGMGDHPTALALYGAILTALLRRERTGRGGEVGTSLAANGVWANACLLQAALVDAEFQPRPPRAQGRSALGMSYRCRDGRWFVLTLLNEAKLWPGFMRALGLAHLADDPRFNTPEARADNAPTLIAELDAIFATADWDHWRPILDSVGVSFGPVQSVIEAAADPQLAGPGTIVDGPNGRVVDSPLWVDRPAAKRPPGPAPEVGADSEAILARLGYDAGEIDRLRQAGIVG